MLKSFYNDTIEKKIVKPEALNLIPPAADRKAWDGLPGELVNRITTEADRYIDFPWPETTARQFRKYREKGDRTEYQDIINQRFQTLNLLILAECMQYDGRYLDTIIDGIWRICEESTWIIPAHNYMYAGNPKQNQNHLKLPDVTEVMIDLRAVMVGSALTGAYTLLGEALDSVTPLVRKRIKHELKKRIIDPFLARDDFWWMNFKSYEGMYVNNWNTYCNTGILYTLIHMEDDPFRRFDGIGKVLRSLDIYISSMSPDGGCDEGPGYWGMAAGTLFFALEMLFLVSRGEIDIFQSSLIREMGDFICKTHIGFPFFVNFADAKAKVFPNPYILYLYGKRTENESLKRMGAALIDKSPEELITLFRRIQLPINAYSVFLHNELKTETDRSLPYYKKAYLPDLQIVYLREEEGSSKGFFLAAKGGHNDESHNHNDIGNYILYNDGNPVIIDAGAEVYTAKTFDPDTRYTIWVNRSLHHNVPLINGIEQAAGKQYRAENVMYQPGEEEEVFILNLEKAYPAAGKVFRCRRKFSFSRKGETVITVEDTFYFPQGENDAVSHLITAVPPEIRGCGAVFNNHNGRQIELTVSAEGEIQGPGKITLEEIPLGDTNLKNSWGDLIYRLVIPVKPGKGESRLVRTFRRI
jgi:hypothetical protein